MRLVICIQYSFCIIENIITFPVYKQFSFCFYWLWKPYSSGLKLKHSRSSITRKICIEFRVLKVTRQRFDLCLAPVCIIFSRQKFFSTKVILNKKKLCPRIITPANNYVPKRDILISQENLKPRELKAFYFQLVDSWICLSLSVGLLITIRSFLRKSCH